jgi:phosphoribosylaminoimidazole-succinocarboxamide synthase
MKKGSLLYEGKAKQLYQFVDSQGNTDETKVWVVFKNSLTAFNALKKGEFANKGLLNLKISSILFEHIKKAGISTHWLKTESENEMIAEKVEIIPLEVVVRNRLAGSTAKKMGRDEGEVLKRPLIELYFKNDALADPFVSDEQIEVFEIAKLEDLKLIKEMALKINAVLKGLFLKAGVDLVDFKIEFGRTTKNQIILADEISPDCMRLWDIQTGEKLDKDRFRRDLGRVQESYEEVLRRIEAIAN